MNYSAQPSGGYQSPPRNKRRTKKKKERSKPFSIFLSVILVILIIGGFALCGTLMGGYVAIIRSIPDMGLVGIEPRTYTSVILDSKGGEISKLHGEENREYATLDTIPEDLQHAIIAIEDERFYDHDGVDIRGFARAVYSTLTHTQLQGGSTITQQLIKNNVTNVARNTVRTKLKEQYLAVKYEKELREKLGSKKAAKDYILELYLNTIGLGHGYNGVKVAAQSYFNKDIKDLDLAECASIAGITNNPSLYSPRTQPQNNKNRQEIILQYMLNQGYISQDEYASAIDEDIYTEVSANTNSLKEDDTTNVHSYFEDALIEQIIEDLQDKYNMTSQQASNVVYNGGVTIKSTMDPDIQKIVDDTYLNDALFPNVTYSIEATYTVSIQDKTTGDVENKDFRTIAKSKANAESWVAEQKASVESGLTENQTILADKSVYTVQPQSAMVIEDYRTGEVKALTGGRGEKLVNRAFNRATDATRQPGSVFKILAAYAPALDTGKITAATTLTDEPYKTEDGYSPKNWYSGYRGNVTLRTAIRDSMNIIAVKTMVDTGIDTCYDYLLNFGFTTLEDDNHAATALGGITNGVKQLELAGAYSTIANGGEYLRPMLYSEVIDHQGNVLIKNDKDVRQVIKASTAYTLTQLMTSVVSDDKGTGKAARLSSGMPVAGKTGTTTDSRDLMFAAYTPYYTCTIWLGYDNYNSTVQNMQNLNQSSHLLVWKYVMEKVHENLEVKDFTPPDGVEKVSVCKISGKKANNYCPVVEEYFETSSVPSEWCSGHSGYYGASEYSYSQSSNTTSGSSSRRSSNSSYSYNGRSSQSDDSNNYSSDDSSTGGSDYSSTGSTGADGTSSVFDTPSSSGGDSSSGSDASEGIE